jgi:hypothetical protein
VALSHLSRHAAFGECLTAQPATNLHWRHTAPPSTRRGRHTSPGESRPTTQSQRTASATSAEGEIGLGRNERRSGWEDARGEPCSAPKQFTTYAGQCFWGVRANEAVEQAGSTAAAWRRGLGRVIRVPEGAKSDTAQSLGHGRVQPGHNDIVVAVAL